MRKLLVFALVLSGCGSPNDAPISTKAGKGCEIHPYGDQIFYFNCASEFGYALQEFSRNHVIKSIASYTWGQRGTAGYWVLVSTKYSE